MLAEILANPVSWPLWAVLAFAVTIYPLGLLLPGCVCCGGGNCTTCGSTSTNYEGQATGYGRMCCSGTIPSSVTIRITRLSAASISTVARGAADGTGTYTKTTTTVVCSNLDGDYVLPQKAFDASLAYRDCAWVYGGTDSGGNSRSLFLGPDRAFNTDTLSWPQWKYYWTLIAMLPQTITFQRCSGYPDAEACSPPGTSGAGATVNNWRDVFVPGSDRVGPYSVQQCSPVGTLLASSRNLEFDDFFYFTPTGCTYKFEVVA